VRTILAIPAFNCARQLPRLLDGIDERLASRLAEVWVIDNRSTDRTVEVAVAHRDAGRLPVLRVFRNRANYGLGGTHKLAFARAGAAGATHVLILHGDNQAASAEAGLLLDVAERNPGTQTVLGSRFSRESRLHGYDRKRIWGNKVLNALYSVVTGRRLQDLGSGLNLFALRDLDRRTYLRFANALTFNYELILDLVARRVAFRYVPITWREEDQVSNARNWRVFRIALVNLLRWRLGRRTGAAPADLAYEWDEVTA